MRHWIQELILLVLPVLIGSVIGFWAGHSLLGLIVGLITYLGYTLWQISRLLHWTRLSADALPPSAPGVWGYIFDQLYRYQRRAQRRQTQLRSVINRFDRLSEAMNDSMVVLTNKETLSTWNAAATSMLGFEYPNDKGQHVTNLLRHPKFVRYFLAKKYDEPIVIRSPVDESRWLQIHIITYGKDEGLMVVRDITRLQRLEQMRRDFVANVSHELRTPLTVLSGYLEPLALHTEGLLPPRMQKGISQMQQQAHRMSNLIDDLLMLSRLENGDAPSPRAPVNVAQLINRAEQDGIVLSQGRQQFSKEVNSAALLLGSEDELHSALTNLVSNAVRYAGDKAHIILRWNVSEEGQGMLSVSDNGEGIEKQHLSRLTERFYRVDKGRSSSTGGTGLGLAIVKHVMLGHQGSIRIESKPGKGSTFTLCFPADRIRPSEGEINQ